ncbi:MAG: bifunctional methylenetetrahydrofolate dehydrogenase/methenyltetrahydrofolate cyclohydrolase FolD [Oscillospiraceae bacterium]|jgi:methylenetetrahydrofolate dehydrogenase (NADP+)/methenyltetrahydrofolate cyclohydrolase|nr:bifunctional methylenetetrahydrofolate dehydrogenase/methenyltetrahydrofolate cyclohydrolase FolD [Oscillospiraceae bacterium]
MTKSSVRIGDYAVIIDGKKISEEILEKIKLKVLSIKKNRNIVPGLAVIMVGDDPASRIYVNNKKKACSKVGVYSREYFLPGGISEEDLLKLISELNRDQNIHGILVQLPLPSHINENAVIEAICPEKDVDCFHPFNMGKLLTGNANILPCTPAGIIAALEHEKIDISSKHCVVVGRSNIVGKPISLLLLQKNATVTICHSKTLNLEDVCRRADILICAVGKANFISKEMVKNNAVVIDVGINRLPNGKICGDVDFDNVKFIASYITPVPGGVGPLTVSMLINNVLECFGKLVEKI